MRRRFEIAFTLSISKRLQREEEGADFRQNRLLAPTVRFRRRRRPLTRRYASEIGSKTQCLMSITQRWSAAGINNEKIETAHIPVRRSYSKLIGFITH
jgi:hypothetical protein